MDCNQNEDTSLCKVVDVEKVRFNFTKQHPLELRRWPIFNLLDPNFLLQIYMVLKFDYSSTSIIATKDEMVYVLDINRNEQLTTRCENMEYVQDNMSHRKTIYLEKMQKLCGNYIKKFLYCSKISAAALAQNGKVYFWYGVDQTPFEFVELCEEFITDIACNDTYFLFLTENKNVYTYGEHYYIANENACHSADDLYTIETIDAFIGKQVLFIACGFNFSVVITDEDKLYSWGNNEYGQLGLERTFSETPCTSEQSEALTREELEKIKSFNVFPCEIITLSNKNIYKVACGKEHTLALSKDGKLYTWGRNNYGQLGIGNLEQNFGPNLLPMAEKIVDIATVYTSDKSVALGCNAHVYIWGFCFDEKIVTPVNTSFSTIYDVFADNVPWMVYQYDVDHTNEFIYVDEMSNDILKCFKTIFNDSMTSDFIIYVENKPIYVHKIILKMRSEHFKTVLNKLDEEEKNSSVFRHDGFSYVVYKAFLRYLYTGVIKLSNVEDILELLTLANAYNETELKNKCNELIKPGITIFNVMILYTSAIQRNFKDLKEYCFQFILKQTTTIISKFFKNLDDDIQLYLIQEIAAAEAFKT